MREPQICAVGRFELGEITLWFERRHDGQLLVGHGGVLLPPLRPIDTVNLLDIIGDPECQMSETIETDKQKINIRRDCPDAELIIEWGADYDTNYGIAGADTAALQALAAVVTGEVFESQLLLASERGYVLMTRDGAGQVTAVELRNLSPFGTLVSERARHARINSSMVNMATSSHECSDLSGVRIDSAGANNSGSSWFHLRLLNRQRCEVAAFLGIDAEPHHRAKRARTDLPLGTFRGLSLKARHSGGKKC